VTTATTPPGHPAVAAPDADALHPLLGRRFSPRAFDPDATLTPDQLGRLLEAARWAPSASNTQPTRYHVGRRGDPTFAHLLAALMPPNRSWAGDASALVLLAAETVDPAATGGTRRWAEYDAGQAAAHLTVQAGALGLAVRQMGGFAPNALPALPAGVTPLAVLAVGVPLPVEAIPDGHPAHRLPARTRRPLDELLLRVA
jgi:nitroreductase